MRKLAAFLLVLGLAPVIIVSDTGLAGAAQKVTAFTLAVLRRDAVIVPFATFTGRRWTNYWSEPQTAPTVPIGIADVPRNWWPDREPVETWTAWPTSGSERPIRVEAPMLIPTECLVNIGLKTDYTSAQEVPPLTVQPYPKDGLATTGTVTIGHVDVLGENAEDRAWVTARVAEPLLDRETSAINGFGRWWQHPFGPSQRAKTPVKLDVLCRSPGEDSGSLAYYFEATKHYPNARNKACEILTFAAGWILKPAKGDPKVIVRAAITDCQMEGMSYTLPLGYLRARDQMFWAVQVSGWGYEHYEVLRIKDKDVDSASRTAGGSCR